MSQRWIGAMPPEVGREVVLEAVRRRRGVVRSVARELGVSRMQVYRYVERFGLWDELRASRERGAPDWQLRARAALSARYHAGDGDHRGD